MDPKQTALAVTIIAMAGWCVEAVAQERPSCQPMSLPVERLTAPPSPYAAFCARNPESCALEGEPVLEWSRALHDQLAAVNAEIRFTPDIGNSGREERWDLPTSGFGDCEDFALEKRRRLVLEGLPSAAMTCAVVTHRTRFYLHAVLLLETVAGTWVLDEGVDEVLCWDEAPYVYRLRERPGGAWTRFAPN
jgi:predicted transglutaminase-like cysteine proteinase